MLENFDINQIVRIIVGLVALYFMIKWISENGIKGVLNAREKPSRKELREEIERELQRLEEKEAAAESAAAKNTAEETPAPKGNKTSNKKA